MSTSDETPRRAPDRFNLYLYGGLLIAALAAFVAWRRARDPHRLWAKKVEAAHAQEIDRPLRRCFGVVTGPELRRLADSIHRGPFPSPLKECHGGPMTELVVAPNSFLPNTQDPPTEVYRLRERHRQASLRMVAAARTLEHELSGARGAPSDPQRESIASKLEDYAHEVEQERQAVADMVAAARDAASPF